MDSVLFVVYLLHKFLYNIDKSLYNSSQSLQDAMVLSVSSVNMHIPI